MPNETPRLTRDVAITVTKYIFENPGKSKSEVMSGAGISSLQFDMAEDFITDSCLCYREWKRTKDGRWMMAYYPEAERQALGTALTYINSRLRS